MIVEQIGDTLFPQVVEEIVKVVQAFPQERISKGTRELFAGEPGSRVIKEIVVFVRQERFSERIVERIGDTLVPQIVDEHRVVFQTFPQDCCFEEEIRISERTGAQFVDELVSRVGKDIVEVRSRSSQLSK